MKRRLLLYGLYVLVVAFLAFYVIFPMQDLIRRPAERDWPEIVQDGVLRAVTEYNAIGFHVEDDTVVGFHYELINAFAQAHGLRVEITPEMSFEQRLRGLDKGDYDVLAYSLLTTMELRDSLLLTHPVALYKDVLIQRRPLTPEDSASFIRSQLELAGQTVHVVAGSPSILRIRHLSDEIADTIYVEEIERYGPEQLAQMVAHGDIDYAVCDESMARLAAERMPEIDISTAIGFTQFYTWAVSRRSPQLLDSLNVWLDEFCKTKAYKEVYRKYHGR